MVLKEDIFFLTSTTLRCLAPYITPSPVKHPHIGTNTTDDRSDDQPPPHCTALGGMIIEWSTMAPLVLPISSMTTPAWSLLENQQTLITQLILLLAIIEDSARYAGLLLAPAEDFCLWPRLFFLLSQKKELVMLYWPKKFKTIQKTLKKKHQKSTKVQEKRRKKLEIWENLKTQICSP